MKLMNIDKYRPIPFWSWNDKLDNERLKNQIALMKKQGIGGFIMHARGGLETEYMGEEWFSAIDQCIQHGTENEMLSFAYDENGWPSGFGNGIVTERGETYQQKYLRVERGCRNTKRTIANIDGYHFYYDVNIYYADLLMPENAECFIDKIYRPYLNRKESVHGFFTDEPQLSRNGFPWSIILPGEYKKEYGENLLSVLPQLFFECGDFEDTRIKYWRLVTRLFSENFFKKLYEFANDNNFVLTGHLLLEESLMEQLTPNGSIMPHYRYFHIPGIDMLGRNLEGNKLAPLQVSSVAAQFGKKQVLSESFALTGWGISFTEFRRMFEWQSVRGITLICNHLQAYSLRGIRKRDFPPSVFYQQPWWNYYKLCADYFARIGYLMSEGRQCAEVLLLHPQTSAWICYNGTDKNEAIDTYNKSLLEAIDILEKKHIIFHLGDETIIESCGRVENDTLIIGECSYKTVVIPPHKGFLKRTEELIEEFRRAGGQIKTAQTLEASGVTDNESITYTCRKFDAFAVHYFVNSTDIPQELSVNVGDSVYDADTNSIKPLKKRSLLLPGTNLITLENIECDADTEENSTPLYADNEWIVESIDENALLLDKCDCYFGGNLIGKDMYVLDIEERAVALSRKVAVKTVMRFEAAYIPDKLYLVCETPEKFRFMVNGKKLEGTLCGQYIDSSMKKIDISAYVQKGENTIDVECDFEQSGKVYEDIEKIHDCEVVRNKFSYTMEIENMYITGDFSLRTEDAFAELDETTLRYTGKFVIAPPKRHLHCDRLVEEGYPFFAGDITLSKNIDIADLNVKLAFDRLWSTVAEIFVNGKTVGAVFVNPMEKELGQYLKKGTNKISVKLTNSLRNLLGPHHMECGDCFCVTQSSFYRETNIWGEWGMDEWNEGYSFIKNGFKL